MFQNPKPYHHLIDLAGFAVGYGLSFHADAGTNMFAGGLVMIMATAHFLGNEYGQVCDRKDQARLLSGVEGQESQALAAGKQRAAELQMPKVNTWMPKQPTGDFVYNQLTVAPKINLERELAKILNTQRLEGFDMDISETFWIRNGHWQGTPETFRATRGKWEHYHIVGKKSAASNSPYVILNPGAVERIASGQLDLPLPRS